MICERCGKDMQGNVTICPFCGAVARDARKRVEPATSYGTFTQTAYDEPSFYEQGYRGQLPISSDYPPPPTYLTSPVQQQFYATQAYPPAPTHMTIIQAHNNRDGALTAEILFSLIGIFGIGWLIGGETIVGVILLICSITIYWPLIFVGTLVTDGFGLVCLGPLAIGIIIVNALLLHHRLSRKSNVIVVPPAQPQPQRMRYPPRPQ